MTLRIIPPSGPPAQYFSWKSKAEQDDLHQENLRRFFHALTSWHSKSFSIFFHVLSSPNTLQGQCLKLNGSVSPELCSGRLEGLYEPFGDKP